MAYGSGVNKVDTSRTIQESTVKKSQRASNTQMPSVTNELVSNKTCTWV